jgi:predicted nucleic acid-binding protein
VILVDTSVWINHLRTPSKVLAQLLDLEQVLIHPFVVGELACGNLANRKEIIALLHALPFAPKADDDEILFFVERHKLMGRGLGLVDVHLLASTTIGGASIWTADNKLCLAARNLGIEFDHPANEHSLP